MAAEVILSVLLGGFVIWGLYLYEVLVLQPKRLRSKLEKQGIRGPPPSSILLGNIPEMKKIKIEAMKKPAATTTEAKDHPLSIAHDWPSNLFPHIAQWRKEYGPIFTYSTGSIQLLSVTEIEMVKEISMCTSLILGRPAYMSKDLKPLLGQGIISSSGQTWSHQRKIISPEFYFDKVKDMVDLMVDSTASLLRSWESKVESEGGMALFRIDQDLRSLSADIISRSSFGSNYSKGKEIFSKLRTLQQVMSQGNLGIPGLRHLPTKRNREIRSLEKEIHSMILEVAKKRNEATYEKDLLQMILEGAKNYSDADSFFSSGMSEDQFIVDNCKNIYFAGHETTAITASWCLLLLAAYPEWQARVRAEVLEICKDGIPNADVLRGMKTLTMVIQETLRLYSPATFISRHALEDIKLKDILIPKGTTIQIPISMVQQLPELWGPDAADFNPNRFEDGIRGACKFPQAYFPFGFGARICVGQNLAMTELKVILSLILSKLSFSLDPAYQHSPVFRLVIEPELGVSLHVRRV
ncbi:cytochrome P450 714C2-like [Rosa rugosa]|uniref:cytochrome P450 714C2-like n=1 Tax=Rosa rugosa TaxID=74645 RepID=UPI002B4091D4|nr:cytochrome P450 714C2-like [Rosa rugosa]